MKKNIKAIAFIFTGIYALFGIYFAKKLIFSFQYGADGINLLPINFFEILLFILAIIIVSVSVLTLYFLTKKRKVKISGKFKMQLFISVLVGGIILYLVVQNGFNQIIVPVALIIYAIVLFNLNRRLNSNLTYLASAELIMGILAFVIDNYDWLLLNLGFGILPIIYVVLNIKKEKIIF